MKRSLILPLLALLLSATPLVAPEEAAANGILVAGNPGGATLPPDEIRSRRPMPQPLPPVRLEGHRVEAKIRDRIAEVTVEQVFRNHTSMQLEGTYLFPLPEGAVVSDFAMTMFGKMVQGEVIERDRARRIYESIVRTRRDPGLLEYMGRGLFQARVFPIEPHKDLTIRLQFQQVLPENDGTLEFRYPLATDRLNAATVSSVAFSAVIDSEVDVKGVYSPSHAIAVSREGDRRARVSFESSGTRQDKDLILYVSRSADPLGFSLLSHKEPGQDGTFLAVFAPGQEVADADRMPKDVVYVLDTSGSMAGAKIAQARRALAYGVSLLRPGDRFNVIGFSMNVYPFRDALVEASEEMKTAARGWIDALQPRGGTNISEALAAALAMRGSDRLFMVVFLTDGKPTMGEVEPKVIVDGVKRQNTANTRVFTFGVGFDLDVNLLDQIAEVTNGSRDYVTPEEDIEVATGRFFRKVDQPVLTDVRVEFGSGVSDVYPQRLPDIFAGGQVNVFGRYRDAGERTIVLRGRIGSREVAYEYNAKLRADAGASHLPRLWASRKVATLLDAIRLHGEDKELVDEVVRLATRYAIVTPYTAGLVVEESELAGRRLEDLAPQEQADASTRWRRQGGGRTLGGFLPPGAPAPGAAAPIGESAGEAKVSEHLAKLKKADGGAVAPSDEAEEGEARDERMDEARRRVREVEGKTFLRRPDGTWVDTAWDGKGEPTKVEAFSEAYFALLGKGDRIARWLGVGDRLIVKIGDVVYEVTPAP
jgi:Ca-activated chloride channel family protein